MFTIACIMVIAAALVGILVLAKELHTRLGAFVLATFASRIALHDVVRNTPFFSHGQAGGDSLIYEAIAAWIAGQWGSTGFSFKTAADLPEIGATSLPPNLFATIIYMNGGQKTSFACTALVAFACCITALDFYKLALSLGANKNAALTVTAVLFTTPAMVFHSADMYKDHLSLLFTFGALSSSIRLSRSFSLLPFITGFLCLIGLWFVRFYLVFLCLMPLAVGYMGLGSKSWTRPILWLVALTVVFGAAVQNQAVTHRVDKAWDMGTGQNHLGNRYGGSAIAFEPGLGSLPTRLLYTIFAPFPWVGGSLGMQLGKIDTLVFYWVIARAAFVARRGRKLDRAVLVGLAAFLLPMTVAYALSLANVGLVLRQRIPIVVVTALFGLLPTERVVKRAAANERGQGRGGQRGLARIKRAPLPARSAPGPRPPAPP